MAEPNTMDNRTLLRRTLVWMSAMVGGCVVVVGTITLVAVSIVGRASSPRSDAEQSGGGSGTVVPAANVHGSVPGSKTAPVPTTK
jgi:hypothetical protein